MTFSDENEVALDSAGNTSQYTIVFLIIFQNRHERKVDKLL